MYYYGFFYYLVIGSIVLGLCALLVGGLIILFKNGDEDGTAEKRRNTEKERDKT
jgi:hypothetical protein